MARWLRPCSLLLLHFMLVATAVADEEKCTTSCGTPCGGTGSPCTYASPPPPSLPPLPPPVYSPPPPPVYSPPPPVVYPPPPAYCPPPPVVYPPPPVVYPPPAVPPVVPPVVNPPPPYEPTPGYNPTPSGWFTPPNMPSYLTPPGTLYPHDLGFRPNGAAGCGVAWRAAIFTAASVAGVLAL